MDYTERLLIAGTLKMAGITQRSVADFIGCGDTMISLFLKGRRSLPKEQTDALRKAAKLAADGRFLTALEAKRKELQQG